MFNFQRSNVDVFRTLADATKCPLCEADDEHK